MILFIVRMLFKALSITQKEKIKNIVHKLMLTYATKKTISYAIPSGIALLFPKVQCLESSESSLRTIGNNIISTAFTTIIMDYF